jgi:hypothetical protein
MAANETTVRVAGSVNSPGIGYPREDVFALNEPLYAAIAREQAEDARGALWQTATPFVPKNLPGLGQPGH